MDTSDMAQLVVPPPGNYVLVLAIRKADLDLVVSVITGEEETQHKSTQMRSTPVKETEVARVEEIPTFQGHRFLFALLATLATFEASAPELWKMVERFASWLSRLYRNHVLFTGIIYLHPISDDGLGNHAQFSCSLLQKVVGKEAFPHLILGTSMWNKTDAATGDRRLNDLTETFWADMIAKGARTARFYGDENSFAKVVGMLPEDGQTTTLAIQREMVDDGLDLTHTSVGLHYGRDWEDMSSNQYERLLEGLLHEYWLATERSDEALASLLRVRLAGVRASLQQRSDDANSDLTSVAFNDADPVSNPASGAGSLYTALQPGQIRLVELRAGEADTPVEISLVVVKIEDDPKYEALSHVVGTGNAIDPVRVRSGHRIVRLEVSQVLEHILKVLRRSEMDRRLWVDELSINQRDVGERSAQVRMMSRIFRAAQNVCIWLGPEQDNSNLAMDFVPNVVDFESLDAHVQDENKREEWTALARLLGRSWFTRRWVVQEMALAKQANVHCGSKDIPWSQLAVAAELFNSKWLDIQRIMGQNDMDKFGDAPPPGAASLVDISSNVFRRDANGAIQERLLSIESLLASLPMFDVTDVRDGVYAIMDLAKDLYNKSDVPVNYDMQPADLFKAIIRVAVRTANSLDILCRPWAPAWPSGPSPSWIRKASDYAYVRRDDGQYDRHNADSLVGLPGQRRYRAAGTSTYHIRWDGLVLSVRGIKIGTIRSIGGECVNGNIPENWMTLGGWPKRAGNSPESFWRTLVADRAPDGSNPPRWYGRAFEHSFRKSFTADVDTSKLIRRCQDSSSVQEFLRRVRAVTWKRRFFVMKPIEGGPAQECLGIGPARIRTGDAVCVLYGCSVPVVLGPKKNKHGVVETNEDGDAKYYEMLGECFVYGMMEGQARRGLRVGSYKESKFAIK